MYNSAPRMSRDKDEASFQSFVVMWWLRELNQEEVSVSVGYNQLKS